MINALRLQTKTQIQCAPLLSIVLLGLMGHQSAMAANCPSSTLAYTNTATTECPGYNPSDPTTVCKPYTIQNTYSGGQVQGNLYQGPLTQAVLAGCDPPITLRPDSGVGKISNNVGSITQGGKCPPPTNADNNNPNYTPTCPVVAGSNAPDVPAASPLANPFVNQNPIPITGGNGAAINSIPPSGGSGNSLPGLPCGAGVSLLNQIQNMGDNVNLGSILTVGNINIGIPPVNLPNFNITVPSLSMGTLNIPDLTVNPVNPPTSLSSSSSSTSISGSSSSSSSSLSSSLSSTVSGVEGSLSSCLGLTAPGSLTPPQIGSQIDISVPSIQSPNANLGIPSLNIPNFNINSPGTPSIQNLNSEINMPNFNVPSLNFPLPTIPNFGLGNLTFTTPMPSLSLPTVSLPSLSLPSLNLPTSCSNTPTVGSEMGTLDNLLSGGLLSSGGQSLGGLLTSGLNTIATLPNALCPGSNIQVSQTGVSLILPSLNNTTPPLNLADPNLSATVASLSPPIPVGSQVISYPPAGAVYNMPVNSTIGFNVNVVDDLILPGGGTTISPSGMMETLAGRSMLVKLPLGPWDNKPEQIVVGTDIDPPYPNPFPTTTNRESVAVQFPTTIINGCKYVNIGVTNNGKLNINAKLDTTPFWVTQVCNSSSNSELVNNNNNNNNSTTYTCSCGGDGVYVGPTATTGTFQVFTLKPLVQDYSAIPASAPNIPVTTSAIVMNVDIPPTTVPSVTPPSGSFLSIPDNTPITLTLNTGSANTLVMPEGGSFTDPTGNTVDLGPNSVLQTPGNNQITVGYALQNADGTYSGQYTMTGGPLVYATDQMYVSVTTTEIEVPAGASLPLSPTGTISMPQEPN